MSAGRPPRAPSASAFNHPRRPSAGTPLVPVPGIQAICPFRVCRRIHERMNRLNSFGSRTILLPNNYLSLNCCHPAQAKNDGQTPIDLRQMRYITPQKRELYPSVKRDGKSIGDCMARCNNSRLWRSFARNFPPDRPIHVRPISTRSD